MVSLLVLLSGILLVNYTNSINAESIDKVKEISGFLNAPESVVYNPKDGLLIISNMNGDPTEADGNGYLSLVSLNGTVIDPKWIAGLNAPKGMAISVDKLYVSDIGELVEIDIENGNVINKYKAPESILLNDVSADNNGTVYVSDMMANAIYKLQNNKFEEWIQSPKLENPNGILAEENQLIVGSWGPISTGFQTKELGNLKTIDLHNQNISIFGNGKRIANIDGVESNGKGGYYITDWMAGKLISVDKEGNNQTLLSLEQGSADHEVINNDTIIVPLTLNNTIGMYRISE